MERLDVDPGALSLLSRFAAALDLERADHGGRLPRVPGKSNGSTGRLHFGGRAAPANDKTDLHGRGEADRLVPQRPSITRETPLPLRSVRTYGPDRATSVGD
jgi:hypothetical protein